MLASSSWSFRAALLAAISLSVAFGCGGGGDAPPTCSAPSPQACTGPNGCQGNRYCVGTNLSSCICSHVPDAGAPEASALGTTCAQDGDCPTGAFCLQNDSRQLFGGAPPAGTCVAACDPTAGCARFAGSTCVNVDDPTSAGDAGRSTNGLCFESCQLGNGAGAATAAAKCHDRAQIACSPLEGAAGGAGYCRPICATSGECLTGVCDPARGVCVESAPTDPGFALRCSATTDAGVDAGDDGGGPDAGSVAAPMCGGLCVGVGGSAAVCSRRCLFGSTDECAPETSGRRRGGCLFVTKGGGIGDLGYCAELCDCNGDCTAPSFVCDAFDDATLEAAFTRKGVCTSPELVVNRPLPCAN